jgi:flavin-binding protein dodecin
MSGDSVARVTEISARSTTSFEDAVTTGLARAVDAAWCQVGLDQGAVGGWGEPGGLLPTASTCWSLSSWSS